MYLKTKWSNTRHYLKVIIPKKVIKKYNLNVTFSPLIILF